MAAVLELLGPLQAAVVEVFMTSRASFGYIPNSEAVGSIVLFTRIGRHYDYHVQKCAQWMGHP